jgi:hypothetical protein
MRQIPLRSLGLAILLSPSVPVMADVPPPAASFAQKLGALQSAMRSGELSIAPAELAYDSTYCSVYFCQSFNQAPFSQFSQFYQGVFPRD